MDKRQEKRTYHYAAAHSDEEPQFSRGPIGFRGFPLNAAAWAFVFKYFFALGFLYMLGTGVLLVLFGKLGIEPQLAFLFFFPCAFTHLIWFGTKMSRYMD